MIQYLEIQTRKVSSQQRLTIAYGRTSHEELFIQTNTGLHKDKKPAIG